MSEPPVPGRPPGSRLSRMPARALVAAGAIVLALAAGSVAVALAAVPDRGSTTSSAASKISGFVERHGKQLRLNGKQFRFAGANNYYLMYKSPLMVDDVFDDAQAAGFNVIRTWGFLEVGALDGTGDVRGKQEGVYLQYWDLEAGRPAYNEGADGLQKLDYVLASAAAHNIRLVVALTNNWNDFGGIDQYVRWRERFTTYEAGRTWYHDDFYTDPVIKGWYKDWITALLNRTNTITGVAYKDDPAVMAWELANEPRCQSAGVYGRSPDCTTQTLIDWADEMATHIKSIDSKHLTSVGDEGFFCDEPGHKDWTRGCGEGVDTIAFASLPNVDFMSFHIYPKSWDKDLEWTYEWIRRHVKEADKVGKPVMWGEFGWSDKATRNTVYQKWTDIFHSAGGDGWLYWILSGVQDDGTLYPDYDGYTVYCPSPVCTNLSNAAAELLGPQKSRPPVADHDSAVVEFGQTATLLPSANDIAYRTKIRPQSVDLDPAVAGQQKTLARAEGTFALQADGTVTFTPAAGFVGSASATYVIQDQAGRWSNVADLSVMVKPDPTAAIQIATFESGTEGWRPANWMPDAGLTSQTADFATEGSYGLHLDVSTGHWFGPTFATPLDLSGKTRVTFDLRTGTAGTSVAIAMQVGDGWSWCQSGGWPWVNAGTTTSITVDLLNGFSCGVAQLNDVRSLLIFFNPGSFDIDNVRAL